MLAFLEVEMPNPKVMQKLRNYAQKWRPLRLALPTGELDALGIARGPKFDKILEDLFELQLRGKGRVPEDRTKVLRKLAGIKDEPKKKPEKEKKSKGKGKAGTAAVGDTSGGAEASAPTTPPGREKGAKAGAAAPTLAAASEKGKAHALAAKVPAAPVPKASKPAKAPAAAKGKKARR
jgi:hypothetical protein